MHYNGASVGARPGVMKKLLIVLTNASTLTLTDGTDHPSGYWAEELVVPYERFANAGYAVDIATLGGVAPSVDRSSLDPEMIRWVRPADAAVDDAARVQHFRKVIEGIDGLRAPLDLGHIDAEQLADYAGVYISGGHGCMQDMPAAPAMTRFLLQALARDMPIASVCHGPTAFLAPRESTGQSPFEGYRMTCFSHAEEFFTPINGKLPLVLEIEVKRIGAHYSKAPGPWGEHVVVDRNLVTGQNPHSSDAVARTFLRHLDGIASAS